MAEYDIDENEDYEPGSSNTVLRNKLHVTNQKEIGQLEAQALEDVYIEHNILAQYNSEHQFTHHDIFHLHQ